MTKPYVIERDTEDTKWFLVCARFPTAYMAKQAWEKIERKVPAGSLGIYRHGRSDEPGVLVTAVSLDSAQVARVAQMLVIAEHEELSPQIMDALIVRRASVVVGAAQRGMDAGRLKWRRPGKGATLTPDGEMIEPKREG